MTKGSVKNKHKTSHLIGTDCLPAKITNKAGMSTRLLSQILLASGVRQQTERKEVQSL